MTKEQSEAIERIKYLLFIYKKDDEKGYRATGDVFDTDFKAIETVLNMLKEKEAEIEKYKKLLASNLAKNLNDSIKAKEKANTDLEFLNLGWKTEIEKKDKMIDLMAEEIKKRATCPLDDYNYDLDCENKCNNNTKECWKQYFERKVEDECKR